MALRIEATSITENSITIRIMGAGNPVTSAYYDIRTISRGSDSRTVNGSSSYFISGDGYYSVETTFTGLSAGTVYTFSYGLRPIGSFERTGTATFTTSSPLPATPYFSSGPTWNSATGNVNFSATTGINTTHLRIERSWVGGYVEETQASSSTRSYSYVAPSAPGTYTIRISARNGNNVSSQISATFTVTQPDPAITNLTLSGAGQLSASWSVTNSLYIRPGNSFAIYLSGPNSASQNFVEYINDVSARSYTRQLDGLGSALIVGATYRIWVYVYDEDGNSLGEMASAVFSRPRPTNFSWSTLKQQGQAYSSSRNEWDDFLDKINDFRAYKGLVTRTFDRYVTYGALGISYTTPSATTYNAARNAINDMSPPTSVPPAVSKGQAITAYHYNRIRDALNSIT